MPSKLKLPCPPGCAVLGGAPIASITMRETGGMDEIQAAGQVKAKGGSAIYSDELVRCAIVEVDGKPVEQPFLEYDSWNSKARAFAFAAWRKMNAINDAEIESFFSKAEAK